MDDVDDGDAEADGDGDEGEGEGDGDDGEGEDGEGEGEEDEGENDNDDDDDQEEIESPSASRLQNRGLSRPLPSPRPLANGAASGTPAHSRHPSGTRLSTSLTSPSPRPSSILGLPYQATIRPEALSASTYDIVPTIAAPQGTSINAVAATPDMRWVFTGGSDGYIRKYNWPDTANGKLMLTVAQRHPFVDSVTKAGVLASYWENEESTNDTPSRQSYDEDMSRSPVYSLCVPNSGLWLLSGTESGNINVQTVRHNEGTRIHTLREHKSAVSVLYLAPDERSVLSGSWDKTILDWDLNVGQVKRSFTGSGGQVSAIEPRPLSKLPVPEESGLSNLTNGTFSSNNGAKPKTNGALTNGALSDDLFGGNIPTEHELQDAPAEQDDDMNSLFGDDDADGGGMEPPMQLGDDDDEFSRAIASGLQQPAEEDTTGDIDMANTSGAAQVPETTTVEMSTAEQSATDIPQALVNVENIEEAAKKNGLPHAEEMEIQVNGVSSGSDKGPTSDTIFLDACHDGTIRVWDRRQPNPIARITPPRGTPPWCMSACWSPDGNFIYAGRRNNSVEEYSLHKSLREPNRSFKFPAGSGPVSAVRTMPNGKHLIWYVFPSLAVMRSC
jgi:transcriptional activator SPT8